MRVWRYSLLVLAVVLLAGCQDNHAKNRAEAMKRWDTARVKLTMNMARQQFAGGEIEKAGLTVQSALGKVPDHGPAYLLMGQIHLEKNLPALARDNFTQCLALEPDNAEAHYHLGVVYERWKDLKQAHSYYLKAWEYQPQNMDYLLALVETEVSLGQKEAALARLVEQVKTSYQQDASVYIVAGDIFTQMGQNQRALEMFRQAYNTEPSDSMVKESLAFALHRVGQAEEALGLFQTLVVEAKEKGTAKSHPRENSAYLIAMGDCYLQLKQYHLARRTFEKMRKQEPLNPVGWARLAQVALARGDFTEAKKAAGQALYLKKDYPDALMLMGYIAFKEGKLETAEFCMQQVLLQSSDNGTAYCLLGQALAKRGQVQQAKGCYRQALKINPDDKLAKRLYVVLRGRETKTL